MFSDQYKSSTLNHPPQFNNKMNSVWPSTENVNNVSLAQLDGNRHNLKRTRPESDEEDNQQYTPFFSKHKQHSKEEISKKRVVSNDGTYVSDIKNYSENQKIYRNGSQVNISKMKFLFDTDRCKKVKAGSQKEILAVQNNH